MGSTELIKEIVPKKYGEELDVILLAADSIRYGGVWNWIKAKFLNLPLKFVSIIIKILRIFFTKDFLLFILELFKKASLLQNLIKINEITSEQAGEQLREYAIEVAPVKYKTAYAIINFSSELVVFLIKIWVQAKG